MRLPAYTFFEVYTKRIQQKGSPRADRSFPLPAWSILSYFVYSVILLFAPLMYFYHLENHLWIKSSGESV